MHVYACGFNIFNQITSVNSSNICLPLKLIDLNLKNNELPFNTNFSAVDSNIDKSRQCANTDQIINIVFLWNKICFLSNNGYLYSFNSIDKIANLISLPSLKEFDKFISISSTWNKLYAQNADKICLIDFQNKELKLNSLKLPTNTNIKSIHCTENSVIVFHQNDDTIKLLNAIDLSIIELDFPFKVKKVSCGKHHILALTVIGVVFSYGNGGQGQLGHDSVESCGSFRVIEALEGMRIDDVSAGGWHSLALSDCGDVYVWGWNNYGQLGLPSSHLRGNIPECINIQPFPYLIEITKNSDVDLIANIACGSRHSIVRTTTGQVYAWGWNKYGQLGLGTFTDVDVPTMVSCFKERRVQAIFAGMWNSGFCLSDEDAF